MKSAGDKIAVFGGDGGFNIDTIELADVKIALAKHTTGNEWDMGMDTMSQHTTGTTAQVCDFIMESDAGMGDGDGFAKAADTMREARQMHANIKRCITVAASTFGVLVLFGLLNLFVGVGYVLEAVLISTLAVLVIPALSLIFVNNELDLESKIHIRPSPFIGRGKINKQYLIGAGIQGLSLLVVLVIMFVIFGTFSAADMFDVTDLGRLRAVFMTVFTSGTIVMAWVGLSAREPFYKSCKAADFRGLLTNPAIVITAGLLLFVIFAVFLPHVNAAFGLAAIHPGIFVVSLLAGAISQLWFEFVKGRFYG
jgi:Ca2+-transporting ATPase